MLVINDSTVGAHELGRQRPKLPVFDAGSEDGNITLTMDHPMRELFIANDSESDDLTFTVYCRNGELTFTLKHCETFDERLELFTSVDVEASGEWRWIVRSGRVD